LKVGGDHFPAIALRLLKNLGVEVIGNEEEDIHPFLSDNVVSAQGEEANETGLQDEPFCFH
jgi:hypothetical protein